jgi:hypothetical protein
MSADMTPLLMHVGIILVILVILVKFVCNHLDNGTALWYLNKVIHRQRQNYYFYCIKTEKRERVGGNA